MIKNNKLSNTREVTFKEDYKPSGTVLYQKGDIAYIHKGNLETLKAGGAKFESKEFDKEKAIEKAVEDFEQAKKTK